MDQCLPWAPRAFGIGRGPAGIDSSEAEMLSSKTRKKGGRGKEVLPLIPSSWFSEVDMVSEETQSAWWTRFPPYNTGCENEHGSPADTASSLRRNPELPLSEGRMLPDREVRVPLLYFPTPSKGLP